jgi:hypothetical protein
MKLKKGKFLNFLSENIFQQTFSTQNFFLFLVPGPILSPKIVLKFFLPYLNWILLTPKSGKLYKKKKKEKKKK